MSFEFPDNFEYEVSVNLRSNYMDDDIPGGYFGALDYVGNYAIISGLNPALSEVRGEFAVQVVYVGHKSVAEALRVSVWRRMLLVEFGSNDPAQVREMHFMAKQSFADLQEIA